MSDSEKVDASPQKEEDKMEKKPELSEEKASKPEKKEEEKMDAEEENTDVKEDKSEKKSEPVEESPKKVPKRRKKIVKEQQEEEELPLGLLERPVIIESGKREKRKVERLAMTMTFNLHEKKKIDVPEGSGQKLGDCARIEYKIAHTKADDLKPMHRIMFARAGTPLAIKRNIRQFCGFSFSKDDKEYDKRLASISKLSVSGLKLACDILDLEKSGIKEALVQRVMEFLMCPSDSGRKPPVPKKRGRVPKGVKRKRGEKKKRKTKEDVESEDNDDDDEGEEEQDNDNDNDKEEDASDEENEQEEESEEEPPKKKAKVEKPKSKKTEEKKKENDKKEKKEKQKHEKKHEKKETKKKRVVIETDEDSDDSDNENLASKKSGPPNNDELRDIVKKILDGANLEEVTMKTVVKQVYAKYPDFDLSDKKEFIKSTVKQLIS